jgi:outer membrane protein TolC
MKLKITYYLVLLLMTMDANKKLHSQTAFSSFDSVLRYASVKSITLQSNNISLEQAKKAKLAALLGIPEITGNISSTHTNNNKLPVNLFPAEAFGGQPGTYREVTTGVQYVTNLNENIDVKLLNLKGWENLKLAKLNIAAAASGNQLSIKTLYENIAATYFNIVNLQEQLVVTKQNKRIADTLLTISKNKYQEGMVKQQDVNDATVNYLSTLESENQLEFLIKQQYLALKILCDIPETDSISIQQKIITNQPDKLSVVEKNYLAVKNSLLKEQAAYSNYKQYKYSMYPTLSFFQAYTTQQFNTRGKLLDKSVNWIPSSYMGLRLNIPIPGTTTISQTLKARYDYLLAQKNTEQTKIKSALEWKQLSTDFEKSLSQANSHKEIFKLRMDTYEKNVTLYKEGLLSLDQTLNSFTTMVNSRYSLISSHITVLLAKAKIDINNTMK